MRDDTAKNRRALAAKAKGAVRRPVPGLGVIFSCLLFVSVLRVCSSPLAPAWPAAVFSWRVCWV